jgi:hypothetical protein
MEIWKHKKRMQKLKDATVNWQIAKTRAKVVGRASFFVFSGRESAELATTNFLDDPLNRIWTLSR